MTTKVTVGSLHVIKKEILDCRAIQSTSVALAMLDNLEAVGNAIASADAMIQEKAVQIKNRHSEFVDEIREMDAKLKDVQAKHRDPRTGKITNQAKFTEDVDGVIASYPNCQPFYDEQKEMLNSAYETEVEVELTLFAIDDLPQRLSMDDILKLKPFITDNIVVD